MNDLISRQAAIDELIAMREHIDASMSVIGCTAYEMAIEALREPEIIRCKDCKHSEHWYKDKRRCFLWAEDGIDVFDDGYCNYADMREGQDG